MAKILCLATLLLQATQPIDPASHHVQMITVDPVHVVIGRELRRKLVEDVRRIPAPGQENYRASRAAPIERFEPHALFHSYEPHSVR